MKAVLISIKPKWCELIISGKKAVEVRKTKPKLETPFKVYIYCTINGDLLTATNGIVSKPNEILLNLKEDNDIQELNGKVIGEFVCDRIGYVRNYGDCVDSYDCIASCLSANEIIEYAKDKDGNFVYTYGWHISDLVIYDKPRALGKFKRSCDGVCVDTKSKRKCDRITADGFSCNGLKPITRPFQSWGYVEAQG